MGLDLEQPNVLRAKRVYERWLATCKDPEALAQPPEIEMLPFTFDQLDQRVQNSLIYALDVIIPIQGWKEQLENDLADKTFSPDAGDVPLEPEKRASYPCYICGEVPVGAVNSICGRCVRVHGRKKIG